MELFFQAFFQAFMECPLSNDGCPLSNYGLSPLYQQLHQHLLIFIYGSPSPMVPILLMHVLFCWFTCDFTIVSYLELYDFTVVICPEFACGMDGI